MEKNNILHTPNSVKIFSLLPHRNICYKFRQIQSKIISQFSNSENIFFPFLPVFCPIKITNEKIENLIPKDINLKKIIIEKPCFKDSWIFSIIRIFNSETEIFLTAKEEKTDTSFNSSFAISDFPPFPQFQIIPLAFIPGKISETKELEIKEILNTEFSTFSMEDFPINMGVFRMAILNFTWPLDDVSLKKIGHNKNIKYSFNWQIEKAKWIKIGKN